MKRRRNIGLAILAALGVFTLWLLLRRSPPTVVTEDEPPAPPPPPSPAAHASRPAPARKPEAPQAPGNPIIDAVTVEKNEVCEGEETMVTVRAHMPNAVDDPFMRSIVDNTAGWSAPVNIRQDMFDGRTHPQIVVTGRNGAITSAEFPRVTVKPCKAQRRLAVAAAAMPNDNELYRLTTAVVDLVAAEPMKKPLKYRWTFTPDAAPVVTTAPFVEHRFELPGADRLWYDFPVRCEVVAADGETVVGRMTMELSSSDFEAFNASQVVQISVGLNPRFPEMGDDGVVTQRVRLWHRRREPIHIESIERTLNRRERGPSTTEHLDPRQLFGTAEIPPTGIEVVLRLDTKADPTVAMADYELTGISVEGYEAKGRFSIMRPTPPPTPDPQQKVQDPALVARILRAREVLHQKFVTSEDLRTLQLNGAFDDLPPLVEPKISLDPSQLKVASGPRRAAPPP